ncbi:PEPxxWA-CTERM sorting domain-containing protein [Alteripontixanthobacter muriae]|uniref:PEPxxWA-CTERM sorting domain-containing protein n=1 Tax=Alteripontixanthobacter muriae TaxID=2705546 RepID=UPI001E6275C8|nr:PEPxxWA-CTERM sorting domain-containing protein [Alteripontixanthobacter muriae]
MRKAFLRASIAGALALWSSNALAATVVETYQFSATTDGPITSHSGTFSFSYDNEAAFDPTLLSIDFSLGDFIFDASNTGIVAEGEGFLLGASTPNGIRPGTNDFILLKTSRTFFLYTVPGFGFAEDRNPQLELVSGAVPEPSTWAMMLLGFGFIGGAMRSAKRRQKMNVSYA